MPGREKPCVHTVKLWRWRRDQGKRQERATRSPKVEAVRAGSVQDDLPESCPSCGEEDGIVNAGCCRHGKAAEGIEIRNSVRHRRRMPDAAKGPGMTPRM